MLCGKSDSQEDQPVLSLGRAGVFHARREAPIAYLIDEVVSGETSGGAHTRCKGAASLQGR